MTVLSNFYMRLLFRLVSQEKTLCEDAGIFFAEGRTYSIVSPPGLVHDYKSFMRFSDVREISVKKLLPTRRYLMDDHMWYSFDGIDIPEEILLSRAKFNVFCREKNYPAQFLYKIREFWNFEWIIALKFPDFRVSCSQSNAAISLQKFKKIVDLDELKDEFCAKNSSLLF